MPKPIYTIYTDAEITRRKRYHLLMNDKGETVWRSRLFAEMIDWLYEEEVESAHLVSENDKLTATLFIYRHRKDLS